ncbi:hypothetical protein [Planomonospora alba]|uniref:hypothetical protein n=1 Tax=Planomonospora alba TaxID=161354 RepID=UPI0031ED6EE5
MASAGRLLRVAADDGLAASWPRIAPHLPGVRPDLPLEPVDAQADLSLPHGLGPGDGRRLINAHLHVLHLGHGTLCLHAVALHKGGHGAVLLLGGHGAGKTLTAVAMVARGWRVLAGDVALLDAEEITVLGGTAAFLVRRRPAHRWFPELGLVPSGTEKVDLGPRWVSRPEEPVPVLAAVSVQVGEAVEASEEMDEHTARTLWLRASGHLLDRVLDGADTVLRLLEDGPAARRRTELVRTLAARMPIHTALGPPVGIAERIEQLAMRRGVTA